jgi:predicted membrane-bound spermidine synthase
VGFASVEFLGSCVLGLCCCWSVLGWFGVVLARLCEGLFFLAGCVLGLFLFQGLEKSLRLSRTFVVRLL